MKIKILYLHILLFINFSGFSQEENLKISSKKLLKTLQTANHNLTLVYFLEPSCPVSQKYQTVISGIKKEYQTVDLNFTFVFPASFSTKKEIITFANEIDPFAKIIFDPDKLISRKIGAKITPEAFLINFKGEIEYQGAIDDWYYQLGRNRIEPSQHYLRNAIKNYLLKYPIIPKFTEAIGCDIEY